MNEASKHKFAYSPAFILSGNNVIFIDVQDLMY